MLEIDQKGQELIFCLLMPLEVILSLLSNQEDAPAISVAISLVGVQSQGKEHHLLVQVSPEAAAAVAS